MLFQLTPQINECELVSDTDQKFNGVTLKLQNTPVIRSTPIIPHGRYTK